MNVRNGIYLYIFDVLRILSNMEFQSILYKIFCWNRLNAGSISVMFAQHWNVSCAYDLSCYCYSCFVLLNHESFRFISLTRFLKLIIAARQHSAEIYNACRYWSLLVVYSVDIIRLNHFTIEFCAFYCGACQRFYHCTDVL